MTKIALIKDVTISELLHLREQGMTNAQIAKKVGVTSRTILNHIGPQPKKLHKKPGPKAKPLPPVGDKPIIEIPHKSFAERCEEVLHKPDTEKKKVVLAENLVLPERTYAPDRDIHRFSVLPKVETAKEALLRVPEDLNPRNLAVLAREANERKMAERATADAEDRTHIPELIAMFGPDAVTAWLKVSLYNMGIPDCRPMSRKKMLEMLKIMNAGGASV